MAKGSKTARTGATVVLGFGATRGQMLRGALLGTTAIVGVALAGPVMAQTSVNPTGGGTITAPNNNSPTAISDATASGGGVQITSVDTNPPANPNYVSIIGVNYTNTTGATGGAAADGLYARPYQSGSTRPFFGDSTLLPSAQGSVHIATTVAGGAAVDLASGSNLGVQFYANGTFGGDNGFVTSVPNGFINFQLNNGVTEAITGTGASGSTGVNLAAGAGSTVNAASGALSISNFATGINATSVGGATVNTSGGGSISATTTAILASVPSGTAAVSVTSGSAITVGSGGTGISATTSGGAISVTTVTGGTISGGTTGINISGATGASATTLTIGATVAGSGFGVNYNTSGGNATTNLIAVNANVSGGAYGIATQSSSMAMTIANGATVTGGAYGVVTGGTSSLNNQGTVKSTSTQAGIAALNVDNATMTVTNTGLITGTEGVSYVNALTLTNGAGGTITGTGGTAINADFSTNAAANISLLAGSAVNGAITLSNGNDTLQLYNGQGANTGGVLAAATFGSINLGGGTNKLVLRGVGDDRSGATSGNGAAATIDTSTVAGLTNLVKQDSGTWLLTGTAAYTGTTTISGGTLVESNTASALGNGGVSIASGATLEFANTTGLLYTKGTTITGAGTIKFTGNQTTAIGYGGNGVTTISLSSGGLIDVEGGIVNGSSSSQGFYTGNLAGLNIAAGATFNGVEGAIIVDALTGSGSLQGGYGTSGSTTIGINNGSGTFSGVIADNTGTIPTSSLVLTKTGTGTQTLTGVNTYTGATTINGGTLALAGTGAIQNSAVADNATLDISGLTNGGTTVTQLTGNGAVKLGGNKLTLGTAGTIATAFSDGGIAGGTGGQVELSGGGTYVLTGSSSYTGATTIDSGTTLQGGTGTISGSSIIDNGALVYNQASAGSTSQPISGSGTLDVNGAGAVTLNGNITTSNTLSVSGTGSSLTIGDTRSGGGGDSGYGSGVLLSGAGASLSVASTGAIQGGSYIGVRVTSSGDTVNNLGSITNTAPGGNQQVGAAIADYATSGTLTINNGSMSNSTALLQGNNNGINQRGSSTSAITLNNYGVVTGNVYSAIENSGSAGLLTVTNYGTGVIYANNSGNGVNSGGTGGTSVTNAGKIVGVNDGVYSTASATIANTGTIAAGSYAAPTMGNPSGITVSGNYGVYLSAGGTVNNTGGLIEGGSQAGIYSAGGALGVTNSGTISTAVSSGTADGLTSQGTLTLANTGSITSAAASGVAFVGTGSSITNSGTITGGANATYGYGIQAAGGAAGTITNQSGGTLTGGLGGIGRVGTGAVTIDNSGIVTGTSTTSYGVNVTGGSGTITNRSGAVIAGNTDGILSSVATSISNAGTIGTGTVANGMLTVGGAGFGIQVASASITNTGTIQASGASIRQTAANGTLNLVNTGTIGGTTAATAPHGVDPDDTVGAAGAATILNSGTIGTPNFYAVAMAGGGTLTNAASGTIAAGSAGNRYAVNLTGASATINNYGSLTSTGNATSNGASTNDLISRGIQSDNNAATINLFAGSTTGTISTGSGNDTLTLYNGRGTASAATTTSYTDAVSGATGTVTLQNAGTLAAANVGAINLGGGANTLGLRGAGDGSSGNGVAGSIGLDTVSNVGTITKQDAGTWTLTGAATASVAAATINAGVGGAVGSGGLLIFSGSGLTGTINVNGATIRSTQSGAFGTGTIYAIDPLIQFTTTQTNANPIVLMSANPSTDPTVLQTVSDTAITVTQTGAITQGSAGQPLQFTSVKADGTTQGVGTFVLTNTGNAWGGVTTVGAGTTLQGATNTISGGSITDNGVVNFSQTAAGTNVLAISGSGVVQVNGGGNVSLTGAITTIGGVQVGAGGVATLSNASGASGNEVTFTGAGATLNVANGGMVSGTNGNAVYSGQANNTVVNAGTLAGNATYTAVYFNAISGTDTITNTGTIRGYNAIDSYATLNLTNSGTLTGLTGSAVYSDYGPQASATVINSGTITGISAGQTISAAVYIGAGTITNNAGTISGDRGVQIQNGGTVANYAQITGIASTGVRLNSGGNATNYAGGTITATAANAYSVYTSGAGTIDNQGTVTANSGLVSNAASTVFTNEGTITAATNGVWGIGTSVNLTNSGTINAGVTGVRAEAAGSAITNSGTIAGSASGAVGVYMTGGTLTNQSGGVISAGQTNGAYGTAIQLAGTGNTLNLLAGSTVNGSIDASATTDGSNSYTFTGTLNGGFTGGSGNDTVTLVTPVTVTGTLDGGAGTDTLVLDGTGTGSLNGAQVINFENGVKQGSGTWTLTGPTAASPTSWAVNAGTLSVAGGDAIADTAAVTIASGATLNLAASETIGSLAGAGNVTLGANTLTTGVANASPTFAGVISGSGGLTKVGTGTLTLAGTNTYTGATTVSAGTLALGATNAIAAGSALSVASGATFNLATYNDTVASVALSGTLNGTGTLTAATYTLNGASVNANLGTGTLTQASGTSTLSGTTSTNTINVTGGTLSLAASDRIVDTAAVTVAAGATLNMATFTDTVGTLALSGTLAGTGTLTATSYTLNGGTVTANLGTGTLTQASGSSTLGGTTNTNTVNITGGTLSLGASNRIVDTAAVTVASGATLNFGANSDTVGTLALNGTLAGSGTLTAATYTLNGAAVNANLGAGTLVQVGGVSVLSGTSIAAATNVNAGTLRLGASERIVDTSVVTIANGATFDLAGYNETIGQLTGAGSVTLGAGTLTTGGNATNSTYAGVVSGTGNLTKVGSATLTLTGANTLTGAIAVNAGTLALLGSTAGAARVAGGTLSGTGQIGGNLAVSSGTLSIGTPTQAIGTMSAGSLTVTGGTSVFDFAGATGGFTADRLNVAGAATLTGGTLVARATEASANYRVMQTYTLIQAGSLTGTFANTGFTQTTTNPDLYYRLRYDLSPNAVVLEVRKMFDFTAGLAGAGASGNQLAVAAALNGSMLSGSDAYASFLNAYQALGTGDRLTTLGSISGQGIADVSTSVGLMNQRFTELLRRRLATGGGSSAGGASLIAAAANGATGLANARAVGALDGASQAFADGTGDATARGGAWVQSFGGYGLLRGQAGSANLYDQSYGIAGGIDGRLGPITLGVAGSGAGVDTRVAALATKGNGTIYQGAGYAAFDNGKLFASLIGTYFSGDVTSRRTVFVGSTLFGQASGTARAHGFGGSASAGYRLDLGNGWRYTPQVSFEATHVRRDAFTETGAGVLNLAVGSQRRTLYQADAEGRISHVFALGQSGGTVEPYVGGGFNANWGNRAALDTMQITGAPAGTGLFQIDGANLAKYTGILSGGIDGHPSDRVTLGVGLQTHRSPRQKDGAVQIHARIAF